MVVVLDSFWQYLLLGIFIISVPAIGFSYMDHMMTKQGKKFNKKNS